jgi:hypothetical protein
MNRSIKSNIVKIGQRSAFGNPIHINRACPVCGGLHKKQYDTLYCYRQYVWGRLNNAPWAEQIALDAGLLVVKSLPFTEQLLSLDQKILAHPGASSKTSHAQVLQSALVWLKRNGAAFQPKHKAYAA